MRRMHDACWESMHASIARPCVILYMDSMCVYFWRMSDSTDTDTRPLILRLVSCLFVLVRQVGVAFVHLLKRDGNAVNGVRRWVGPWFRVMWLLRADHGLAMKRTEGKEFIMFKCRIQHAVRNL